MPNVFIAGVTGYLGSRLAEELIRERYTVSGLVRGGLGKSPAARLSAGPRKCAGPHHV